MDPRTRPRADVGRHSATERANPGGKGALVARDVTNDRVLPDQRPGVDVTPFAHTRIVNAKRPPRGRNERHGTQLRLLGGHGPDWDLDARTRRIGKRGVAEAKEILRRAKPPEAVKRPLAS